MPRPKQLKNATITALQKLHLSENEAELYSVMIKEAGLSVRQLQNKVPFPRTLLYYILGQLTRRGLISAKTVTKKTVYTAVNPEKLHELIVSQEESFKTDMQTVRDTVSKLRRDYRLAKQRPETTLVDGIVEYEKALDSLLQGDDTNLIRSYETTPALRTGKESRQEFERLRIRKKIEKHTLFTLPPTPRFIEALVYDDFTKYRAIQNDKQEMAPFETDVIIAGSSLLYTRHMELGEPVAVLITDAAFATMQSNIFDHLWKRAETIIPNFKKQT